MDLRTDWGTGVFQVVREEVVSGYVQGVGNQYQEFKTELNLSRFNSANMLVVYEHNFSQILLGHPFVCPITLDALPYAFDIDGHKMNLPFSMARVGSCIIKAEKIGNGFKMAVENTPICCAFLRVFLRRGKFSMWFAMSGQSENRVTAV